MTAAVSGFRRSTAPFHWKIPRATEAFVSCRARYACMVRGCLPLPQIEGSRYQTLLGFGPAVGCLMVSIISGLRVSVVWSLCDLAEYCTVSTMNRLCSGECSIQHVVYVSSDSPKRKGREKMVPFCFILAAIDICGGDSEPNTTSYTNKYKLESVEMTRASATVAWIAHVDNMAAQTPSACCEPHIRSV